MEAENWSEYVPGWEHVKTKGCLPPVEIAKGPLAPWIMWSLWISRNKLVFMDRAITADETLTTAITLAKEWLDAQYNTPLLN